MANLASVHKAPHGTYDSEENWNWKQKLILLLQCVKLCQPGVKNYKLTHTEANEPHNTFRSCVFQCLAFYLNLTFNKEWLRLTNKTTTTHSYLRTEVKRNIVGFEFLF